LTDARRWPRPRLRQLLFFAFLLSGIIPLAVSGYLLVRQNREVLEDQERLLLVAEARTLAVEVSARLAGLRMQLSHAGRGLAAAAEDGRGRVDAGRLAAVLRAPGTDSALRALTAENRGTIAALTVLDRAGEGPGVEVDRLAPEARDALGEAFGAALGSARPVYRFTRLGDGEPVAAMAVPVAPAGETGEDGPALVAAALVRLRGIDPLFDRQEGLSPGIGAALTGPGGELLWTSGVDPESAAGLARSWVVRDFAQRPLHLIGQYTLESGGGSRDMLVQISPVEETGWGIVAQKPLSAAFQAADRLVVNTLISTALLVLLSLFFALWAARQVAEPVQRLAATSHEIAAGSFGSRVETTPLAFAEVADLAGDFNRMSERLERYVAELRRAAQTNRDLFIGSLRAFAAAIDAKDPYTRGHSERVATVSRTIARRLGLAEPVQHRVWVGALLHDIGKIGVDDRILKKTGVLTADEFEQMKAHTVVGADILRPIGELQEMIPAVRWHHESWDGRGYPDGLAGERIPLIARVVAVADTFDALTTNRPYQQAYGLEQAVATIRRLVGSRFDAKVVSAFLSACDRGEVRMPPRQPVPAARPVRAAGAAGA